MCEINQIPRINVDDIDEIYSEQLTDPSINNRYWEELLLEQPELMAELLKQANQHSDIEITASNLNAAAFLYHAIKCRLTKKEFPNH